MMVKVIRCGSSVITACPFEDLRAGDTVFLGGRPVVLAYGAHASGDASYDGYLAYNEYDDAVFPENTDEADKESAALILVKVIRSGSTIPTACPFKALRKGDTVFCKKGWPLILCEDVHYSGVPSHDGYLAVARSVKGGSQETLSPENIEGAEAEMPTEEGNAHREMTLSSYLGTLDFTCEVGEMDTDEIRHRLDLMESGDLCCEVEDVAAPMYRLVDQQGANLGDIDQERFFGDAATVVKSIVDRLQHYAQDNLYEDYKTFLDEQGINYSGMNDEELILTAHWNGFAKKHPGVAEFARAYLYPETIQMDIGREFAFTVEVTTVTTVEVRAADGDEAIQEACKVYMDNSPDSTDAKILSVE